MKGILLWGVNHGPSFTFNTFPQGICLALTDVTIGTHAWLCNTLSCYVMHNANGLITLMR